MVAHILSPESPLVVERRRPPDRQTFHVLGFATALAMIGCGRMDFDPDGGMSCVGSLVRTCFSAPPATMPMTVLEGLDINTDTSPMCDEHNDKTEVYCVVIAGDFTLTSNAVLRAHGLKPLVLLSTGTISLQATARIDVSSRHAGPDPVGAGGDASTCLPGTPPIGSSGGYGGSFQGHGGEGKAAAASQGGLAASGMPAAPQSLRGGCPGSGGDPSTPPYGAGGDGGGAVALVAAKQIDLAGTIDASGAGGQGGSSPRGGGGGGGSGGMIVLDAPMIVPGPDALLFANGGGGGGGTGGAQVGLPGSESPEPGRFGGGGLASGPNGAGASGSSGDLLNGMDAVDPVNDVGSGGGGGGGGGAGFIHAPGFAPGSIAPLST